MTSSSEFDDWIRSNGLQEIADILTKYDIHPEKQLNTLSLLSMMAEIGQIRAELVLKVVQSLLNSRLYDASAIAQYVLSVVLCCPFSEHFYKFTSHFPMCNIQ